MELLEIILEHVEFYGRIILSIGVTLSAIGLITVGMAILLDDILFGL